MKNFETLAREKVENTPGLKAIEDILFYDWPNWNEHMQWIVETPVNKILDWAMSVEDEVQ